MSDTISVLTPSYQYARFISDAIDSVAGQELSVEHIVQDGESTDGTVGVLSKRSSDVDWRSEPDDGQSDALNRALRRASGGWIAWLNADEFLLPGALSRLRALAQHTGADVVLGDCVFVDETGRFERLLTHHRFSSSVLRHYGCYITSCSVLFRRDVLSAAPWDPGLHRIMDWNLYLQLSRDGARFEYAPFPVGAFRAHSARKTSVASGSDHALEYDTMRTRYDMQMTSSVFGRTMHAAHKLWDLGYLRQWRSRPLHGTDLRWFDPRVGIDGFERLVRRCYR